MSTRHGKPRDPEREQFWRHMIADQAQSNLAIAAYCRRNRLSPPTFRFWQRELARRDAQSSQFQEGGGSGLGAQGGSGLGARYHERSPGSARGRRGLPPPLLVVLACSSS